MESKIFIERDRVQPAARDVKLCGPRKGLSTSPAMCNLVALDGKPIAYTSKKTISVTKLVYSRKLEKFSINVALASIHL